jgi:PIN domain nuclease of toxin-antitoxin system
MPAVLLDTCAIIFAAEDEPMSKPAREAVVRAALNGELLVSPVSAWEIGMLAEKKRLRFSPDPKRWFFDFLAQGGVNLTPLTAEAAIDASMLPRNFHGDPADRLLIATARQLDVPIVTRDRAILAYAKAGHVKGIAC